MMRTSLDAESAYATKPLVALVRPDRAARGGAGLQQQHRRVAFVPVAWVAQTLFLASLASLPLPFRCNIASGSVVD